MDTNQITKICAEYNNQPDTLLEILHDVQHQHGYLPKDALIDIANILNISRADIHGVVSFYDDFRREPPMWPNLKICRGEACQAVGGEKLVQYAQENLQNYVGVENVYCLGNCALGPAVLMAEELFGRVTPEKLHEMLGHKVIKEIVFHDE